MASLSLFHAEWHAHSQDIVQVMKELEKQFKGITFHFIDADNDQEAVQKFQVSNIPTLVLCKPGERAQKIETEITAPKLLKLVQSLPNEYESAKDSEELRQANLNRRIQAFIDSAPIMIFMKGDREAPRCKFSKQLMKMFQEIELTNFNTFNILEDEDVRQGIKTYSNWKTFPQVYVDGNLIGGVNIVEEMIDGDEFQTLIQPHMETLDQKLKRVINKDRIMLFMKGNVDHPQCGFSNRMVELLQSSSSSQFSTFDILSDNEVRQGLKTYSNWPTYPQLYIDGELIGGLDVCVELKDDGELKEMLDGALEADDGTGC